MHAKVQRLHFRITVPCPEIERAIKPKFTANPAHTIGLHFYLAKYMGGSGLRRPISSAWNHGRGFHSIDCKGQRDQNTDQQ